MEFAFGKDKRLLSGGDYREVLGFVHRSKNPRRFMLKGDYYIVYRRPRAEGEGARLGVSVSKKVVRRANRRNRVKRCLREYFRHHLNEVHEDVLVRFTKTPPSWDFDDLSRPLAALEKRAS